MSIDYWAILETLTNLLDSYLILLIVSSSLRLRYDQKWLWLVYTVILSIICSIANTYCASLIQLIIVLSISLLLFTLFFTIGPNSVKLLWTLLTQLIFFGVDMLYTSLILKVLSNLPTEVIYQPGPVRLFNIIVSRLILISIVFLIRKKNIFLLSNAPQIVLLISCLLLSFGSLILLAFLFAKDHVYDNYLIISTLLLCSVNVLYIYLFLSLQKRDEIIKEDSLIIQKLESDQERYISIQNHIDDLESWKHDMRKHFHTISSLFQSDDPNKDKHIISYISSIEKGLETTSTFINTGNTLFDNIVCRYCALSTNLKISTKLELLVPSLSFIDAVDLCSILGNMWENAIEACSIVMNNGVEPFIIFRTFVNANHFIIELTNTSNTPPATNFKSSKKVPGHGLGIKSIKKLTKKYHGICDFDASEKEFTSRVAIPVNSASAESIDQCVVLNWRNEI